MITPLFRRSHLPTHRDERGITMILVAVCMVALIAMAALSIDVVTLYLAREETQRAADAAALAAAKLISVSGITGLADPDTDPSSWTKICGGSTSLASIIAQAAAQENGVAGSAANHVTVTYSAGAGPGNQDCTPLSAQFGVNPLVTVLVTRDGMPTLFSRIWSRATNSVSATATAEVFNPSNSGSLTPGGDVPPVTPRCVKPWIIPNTDFQTGSYFVNPTSGAILNQTIVLNGGGSGNSGIGEALTLTNACGVGADCTAQENSTPGPSSYIPALISPPAVAVPPSCASVDYQNAIAGCDGNTVYACGTVNGATADLTFNPGADTATAAACMIRQAGQDTIDVSSYPFQIKAGPSNPIAPSNQVITSSDSIVTLPIYDSSSNLPNLSHPQVTIVGFLQVFIDNVIPGPGPATGSMNVHVLNIAGCGNDASTTLSAPGTSPVPIRLIAPQ